MSYFVPPTTQVGKEPLPSSKTENLNDDENDDFMASESNQITVIERKQEDVDDHSLKIDDNEELLQVRILVRFSFICLKKTKTKS